MTYRTPIASYNVGLEGTGLKILPNNYTALTRDPLVGTYVSASDVITMDGKRRMVITVNGQLPGPPIEVMENSQVQ